MIERANGFSLAGLLVSALAMGAAFVPATASAGDAGSYIPTLVVGEGALGEKNDLVLTEVNGKFRIGEVFFAMPNPAAGSNCVLAGADVDCNTGQIDNVFVSLQGNNDSVQQGIDLPSVLSGGDGNDGLDAGPRDDVINGDRGNDRMNGAGGNDVISDGGSYLGTNGNDEFAGGPGNDLLDGGTATLDGIGADSFNGGAGNDTLTMLERTTPVTITEADGAANDGESGEGDNVIEADTFLLPDSADRVTVAGSSNLVSAGGGADSLKGGNGADQLLGAAGDDSLDGGTGADAFSGGPGADVALFRDRVQPVTVTVGDGANDGEPGESDDVLDDVETVIGGGASDSLGGSDGADTLDGGPGQDSVDGADGNDRVLGGEGADNASGGTGDDTIDGGEGADGLSGGSGDDTIEARDGGPDTIECGSGSDTVNADPIDTVAADCDQPASTAGAPETSLDTSKVRKRKAIFGFSGVDRAGNAANTLRFECELDGKGFKPCGSPVTYKKLKRGKHTFDVRAKNAAGMTDPTPAEKKFKVKRRRR